MMREKCSNLVAAVNNNNGISNDMVGRSFCFRKGTS